MSRSSGLNSPQFCNLDKGAAREIAQFYNSEKVRKRIALQFCNFDNGYPRKRTQFCNSEKVRLAIEQISRDIPKVGFAKTANGEHSSASS